MNQDKCYLKVLHDHPYCRESASPHLKNIHLNQLKHFYEEREPLIGKTGWYYDRHNKLCWVEAYGRAWFPNKEMKEEINSFIFSLKSQTYEEKPHTNKEIEGLLSLLRRGIHKKDIQEILMFHTNHQMLKGIRLRSKMFQRKMLERVRAKGEELKEKHKKDGEQKV